MESHVEGHVEAMWLPCELPSPKAVLLQTQPREARDMSAGTAQWQGGLQGSPPHNCGARFGTKNFLIGCGSNFWQNTKHKNLHISVSSAPIYKCVGALELS
jgi:hypothetical protein